MNPISKKMDALMSLGIPSIVQINTSTAMMKIPPSWECLIDVSVPSYKWVAKSKDGSYDWQKSPSVPDVIKDKIGKVATKYNDVLMDIIDVGGVI